MSGIPHDSALTHVTGQSEFVDDRPILLNEVFLDVVYSSKAHAKILSIDFKDALQLPRVCAVYTADDFSHPNWGTIFQDQPFLCKDVVNCVGDPIVIIAAETHAALRAAKKVVKIKYEELPAVLSISQAIKEKSFIAGERFIERGDIQSVFSKEHEFLEGQIVLKGADHFYLESQAAIAYPGDDGSIEIHSSSQHPTEVQHVVAHALGILDHKVTCIVKRMGGAFGGKESQAAPFAAYAALVAHRLNRPARIAISKDDDMIITGKRNPFQIFYKVAYNSEGMILALDAKLYSDAGAYADLSTSIMERAMLHSDNAYFIPNVKITGQVCRTNFHSHTAFRGFGGPKGVAMIEKVMEEVAERLGKDPLDIRKANCYRPGFDVTPYGQKLENNLLPELFSELEKKCDYRLRRNEIDQWNKKQKNLRGLSLTAVKFGISFTTRFLNQANALVIVHRDGSVQVSTGATEMGQGVNTRISQLVAEVFGVSYKNVRIMPTATDKNGNTSPTAASSGTDLNGKAASLAAEKIRIRLNAVAKYMSLTSPDRWPSKTAGLGTVEEIELDLSDDKSYLELFKFADIINEAYLSRVSLSEYAHYKIPGLSFNKLTGKGDAFMYFTQGVAASEVSIDSISGEVKVLRADILMDLGRPINKELDLGQVTGAFIQGMGWMTTEDLFYSNEGMLLSHSPSTYKIPSIQDIPRIFNIDLIKNEGNTKNIRGTKAVGEPPLLLSISVWTAIRNALSYRVKNPQLIIPATSERVLRELEGF